MKCLATTILIFRVLWYLHAGLVTGEATAKGKKESGPSASKGTAQKPAAKLTSKQIVSSKSGAKPKPTAKKPSANKMTTGKKSSKIARGKKKSVLPAAKKAGRKGECATSSPVGTLLTTPKRGKPGRGHDTVATDGSSPKQAPPPSQYGGMAGITTGGGGGLLSASRLGGSSFGGSPFGGSPTINLKRAPAPPKNGLASFGIKQSSATARNSRDASIQAVILETGIPDLKGVMFKFLPEGSYIEHVFFKELKARSPWMDMLNMDPQFYHFAVNGIKRMSSRNYPIRMFRLPTDEDPDEDALFQFLKYVSDNLNMLPDNNINCVVRRDSLFFQNGDNHGKVVWGEVVDVQTCYDKMTTLSGENPPGPNFSTRHEGLVHSFWRMGTMHPHVATVVHAPPSEVMPALREDYERDYNLIHGVDMNQVFNANVQEEIDAVDDKAVEDEGVAEDCVGGDDEEESGSEDEAAAPEADDEEDGDEAETEADGSEADGEEPVNADPGKIDSDDDDDDVGNGRVPIKAGEDDLCDTDGGDDDVGDKNEESDEDPGVGDGVHVAGDDEMDVDPPEVKEEFPTVDRHEINLTVVTVTGDSDSD